MMFNSMDTNHDGVLSRNEFNAMMSGMPGSPSNRQVMTTMSAIPTNVMSYGAPVSTAVPMNSMSYGAPAMTYGAPVTTAIPTNVRSYGAPMTTTMQAQHRPQNLLAGGHVVGEQPVSRDELIRRGHLFPDVEREQQLLNMHASQPGAMVGPHTHGVVQYGGAPSGLQTHGVVQYGGGPSGVAHHYAAPTSQTIGQGGMYSQPGQTIIPQQATSGYNTNQTHNLEISILHATGLKDLNFSGDAMYVQCQPVPDKNKAHKHGKAQHIATKQVKGTTDPTQPKALDAIWNEAHELSGWFVGETLEFVVYDKGLISSRTEGKAHITSDQFFPHGFEGELAIEGLPGSALAVRIVPMQ